MSDLKQTNACTCCSLFLQWAL